MSFPRPFPYAFESDTYVPDDPGTAPLVYDGAHQQEAEDHLIQQFQGKPIIAQLLGAYTEQVQILEEELWRMLTERRLANAAGVTLRAIAEIVGQDSGPFSDDEELRAFVRARIMLNRSRGTEPELGAILRAAIGDPDFAYTFYEYFPAAAALSLDELIADSALGPLLAAILIAGKPAGVRLSVEFSYVDPTAAAFELSYTADGSLVDDNEGLGYTGDLGLGGELNDARD